MTFLFPLQRFILLLLILRCERYHGFRAKESSLHEISKKMHQAREEAA